MIHIMPWEIDQVYLTVDKLKRAVYYLNSEDKYDISHIGHWSGTGIIKFV